MVKITLNYFLIIIVSCLFLLNSCKQVRSGKDYFQIDVRSSIDNKAQLVLLSELKKDLKYIKLQATNIPLRFIQKVELTDDFILVSDRKGLYKFDHNGQLLMEVGRIGKGPGEHNGNIRFAVNVFQNEILIYSYLQNINVYDLHSGLFKREVFVNSDLYDLIVLENGDIVFFTWELPGSDSYAELNEAILIDKFGNRKDSISNIFRQTVRGNVMGRPSIYNHEGQIQYMFHYRDTLYRIDKSFNKIVHAAFKTDNQESRNNFMLTPTPVVHYPDYISIPHVLENNEFIFLTFQKGILGSIKQNTTTALFKKLEKQVLITPQGIINDLDGGMNFWPQWLSQGKLLAFHQAYEIIEYFEQNQENNKYGPDFFDLVKSLNEFDNPVLVILD
ncbi:MAG: 6-bladed beta-propeller [Bacteroidales bacterium]|nr:6-bladed beta-propeller [Bacteroidales bacterium]